MPAITVAMITRNEEGAARKVIAVSSVTLSLITRPILSEAFGIRSDFYSKRRR